MKTVLRLPLSAALFFPLAALAQSTDARPAASAEKPIVLSAFEVKSIKDTGYRVENAVATTGVAQALIDTPLPITVVTNEFLRDNNLEGFSGALKYASSISFDPHTDNGNYPPGAGRGNSQANGVVFRGQPYNGTFRNGLKLQVGFATENVDRVEVAKGPMAVFVGGATLGGEVNLIGKKPEFVARNELGLRIGSHEYYRATIDSTGPLTRSLAYRLILDYNDKNTWRDWSHSRSTFVNPQLLWRPSERVSTRLEAYHRDARGNLVSQAVSSTQNYQAAFDSPPQALLDLGKKRTGALAGVPYTATEYRTRIGQAFGTWRQDVFDTTGAWVTLGTGEGLLEGNAPDGRRYNWYGPHAGFKEPVSLVESDTTVVATDWLDIHAIARYLKADVEHAFYSFSQRQYADGNNPLDTGSGTRLHQKFDDAKLEAVLKRQFWKLDGKLLLGAQYNSKAEYDEDAFFDYSVLAPVAPSANVRNNPLTNGQLVGQNVFHYFDPRVHAFPDTRLITRWPSEVRAPGQFAYAYNYTRDRATYAAGSVGIADNRVTLTGGARRSQQYLSSRQTDPAKTTIAGSASTQNSPNTNSYMYGATVRVVRGLNAYASYSHGETARTGSLVSRVSFGVSPPDIVTPTEAAANPVPNSIGIGKEAGLKLDLLDRKLSGSIGWFQLTQGGILINDTVRTGNDPRNAGTEVDPNPATANPGVRTRVQWQTGTNGNISEGFETDLLWTPTRNYTAVLGATHLTKNTLTIPKPPTKDPVLLRDYTILNGRPLDRSPKDIVRLFQNYSFTEGRLAGLSLGLGLSHQSESQPQPSNSAWGLVFQGFTTADVTLGYKTKHWGKPVEFVLSITNATNTTYVYGQRDFGAPREFFLSTRMNF